MLAQVNSAAVVGLDGELIRVEVDISSGQVAFLIVGLPDASVQESRERVRAAIKNSGLTFPLKRVTVNLAPADLRKEGPAYDLPIAVALLIASEQVSCAHHRRIIAGRFGAPYEWRAFAGDTGARTRDQDLVRSRQRCARSRTHS